MRFFLGDFLEKSPPNPSKTFTKGFMKTDGEICALSVYEELYGISDRFILSLAPAAILVPPPKMALTVVLGWECCFFIGDSLGRGFFLGDFLKKVPQTPQKLSKRVL